MNRVLRFALVAAAAAALVTAGYATGQSRVGTPKTVLHVVTIQWNEDAPEAERLRAIEGVREMAAQVPGIRNVWLKPARVQPREFHTVFAIEFENRAAAEAYGEHPAREAWAKHYLSVRRASYNVQVTNE
jgi:hypothetical protein